MKEPNPTKLYMIGGVLVEGTKSEGGAFYDIRIVKTAMTGRYLAKIFEANAKEVKPSAEKLGRVLVAQSKHTGCCEPEDRCEEYKKETE